LKGQPVVSESTATNNNYKEMYNSLPFNDVLSNVKRYFIQDITNCPNVNDPLFLILRFKTNNVAIFDSIAKSINTLFGNGNSMGNMLYIPENPSTLDTVKINELLKKVIIIVDTTGLTQFVSSKLNPITALTLGTVNNQIYRENEVVGNIVNVSNFSDKFKNYLNVIYPDIGTSSDNYDFVTTGINMGIQFIGLNAQTKDTYLTTYNSSYFNTYAIIKKVTNPST
jgi:adenosyl cobinamide kinase/adenosyl cobinamide phosphate guanylyltransferase